MFPTRAMTILGGDSFRDEYSLEFDGSNDRVEIPTLTFTDSMSFSFWVKSDASAAGAFIASREDASNAVTIGINSNVVDVRFVGANTIQRVSTAWTHQAWNHVVCVCDSGTADSGLSIYINGVLDNDPSESNALPIPTHVLTQIGAKRSGSSSYNSQFEGKISEIAVYNTLLTASQVKTLYNGREPYNHKEGIVSANLINWWRMGDGDRDGFSKTSSGLTDGGGGLIQDVVSNVISTDLVTGWANTDFSTAPTFSGLDVSDAISDGASNQEFVSNSIDITAGDIVEISFTITAGDSPGVPSSNLTFKLSEHTSLNSTQFDCIISSAGNYHFFAQWTATDSSSYVGFRASSEACDFDMTNFVCKRITGGSPGIMLNMTAVDIIGDTP